MAAMWENDLCNHSKLKQEEPLNRKHKKTRKMTEGVLYITYIFMDTFNLLSFSGGGVLNEVS